MSEPEIENQTGAYYATVEAALKEGMESESGENKEILSIREWDQETIVLFLADDALGHASISKTDRGFRWYRSTALIGLKRGTAPEAVIKREAVTENGMKYALAAGAVDKSDLKRATMNIDGSTVELEIHKSGYFYFVTNEPIRKFSIVQLQ